MDIAIKQRILGGVVLLAGAVLFLPMLLEGSGVKALQPPELPVAPATPSTAELAPPLQQKAQELEAGVAASHGDPTFYEVQPPQGAPETVPTPAVPEQFHVVNPPAAKPAAPAVAQAAVAPAAEPVKAPVAVAEKGADKAAEKAAEKQAAAKAQADRLAAEKAAAAKAAAAKLAADKVAVEKAAAGKTAAQAQADKLAAEKAAKAAADKAAAEKAAQQKTARAAAMQDPDPALPQAWVVQAGNFAARDKAQALVDKLRGKGFRASLAGKDGGWRVIIGPELDKSLAESAKKRLASDADLKLSGWIQAYRP